MSSLSSIVLLLTLLMASCPSIFAQSRCVTTAYGPIVPSVPLSFVGLASNLINMVPINLTSTMQVAAIGVYPMSQQSIGTLNITCGLYSNTTTGFVLLSQTPPIAVIDLTRYTNTYSITPMAVYLQPAVSAPAGLYVIGCWWTWTGSSPFMQAYTLGAPTTQAIGYYSTITNSTLVFNTSNGLLPALIATQQQTTEIVSLTPGVMASLISASYYCPPSSSSTGASTGSNGAFTAFTSSSSAVILTVLALLALLN
jgi:hypothetical protein